MSGNIKKLYTYSGKFDYQHQYKAIIEVAMVSNSEIFTNNSPILSGPSVNVKNTNARNPLRLFTEVFGYQKGNCCPLGRCY